tara:strand:- start:425 stop:1231 length:807 start_codon:yes stop_codon:yes gene_type:complete
MPDPLGDISFTWYYILIFLIGYLSGSIPFGIILTKLSGYGDLTKIGSGNIGATNVLRTGNKLIASLTLVFDILKGLIPTIIILKTFNQDLAVVIASGSVLGHIFPFLLINKIRRNIFFNINIFVISFLAINIIIFGKGIVSVVGIIIILINLFFSWGGKSVATSLGVIIALNPIIGIICIVTWLIVSLIFKYSSLSAIICFTVAPSTAFIFSKISVESFYATDQQIFEFYLFLCVIIWIRHIKNIKNLLSGKEPKIGKSSIESPLNKK